MKELTIKDIIYLKTKGIDKFIYFLIDKGEIVYIGKSNGRLLCRINSHLKDKEFDNVKYLSVNSINELNRVESELISNHKPKYNKLNVNNKINLSSTVKMIIKSKRKTKYKVKRILEEQPNLSSKAIGEVLNKSTRTIERHKVSLGL